MAHLKEYTVYGTSVPTATIPSPTMYKLTVWERNEVVARSEFSKILKHKYKIKNPLIVRITEEKEKITDLNIYGIKFVLSTKKRKINMYKEFKGVSRSDVVSDLYSDMAGRHSAHRRMIKIVSVGIVEEPKRKHLNESFPIFKTKAVRTNDFIEE